MKNNHKRTLESFQEELEIIRSYGFNPIGVSQVVCESTFIFETIEEVNEAYEKLEKQKGLIQAWWYTKEDFLSYVKEYEASFGTKVLIYWL